VKFQLTVNADDRRDIHRALREAAKMLRSRRRFWMHGGGVYKSDPERARWSFIIHFREERDWKAEFKDRDPYLEPGTRGTNG
jgi:hypothetical protein